MGFDRIVFVFLDLVVGRYSYLAGCSGLWDVWVSKMSARTISNEHVAWFFSRMLAKQTQRRPQLRFF